VLAEAADLAAAAAKTGDASQAAALAGRRQTLLESLVELNAARPHMAALVEEARRLLAAGPASATTPPPERRP
jgi:hypothetical protein